LLAGYAVLFLYASNLSDTDPGEVLPVLLAVVVIAALLLVGGTLVLRSAPRAAILLSALIAFFFGYRHLVVLGAGSPLAGRPSQALWVLLGIGTLILVWRGGRSLKTATRALNALGLALIVVALAAIVPHLVGDVITSVPATSVPQPSVPPPSGPQRDIWVLVFDRYGSAESLRLNYGIEESLTPWLAEQGFHVSRAAHANYWRTSLSLASVLNLDYLDALPPGLSAAERLRDHALGRFLTDRGYRYIHIGSVFGPTRTAERATINRRLEATSDFSTALFDSTLAPNIVHWIGRTGLDARRQRQADWARFELQALEDARTEPGPKFVFAHLLLPHPPYVFEVDGGLVPDGVDARRSSAEAYEAQMHYLDARIKDLLEPLLAEPTEDRPIIILMADEGPYPERYEGNPLLQGPDPDFDWSSVTDEELRIKFGILHAMMLPGIEAEPDVLTAVNTFRVVLNAYFDAELPLLPDRILVPESAGPGTVDVADRLGLGR